MQVPPFIGKETNIRRGEVTPPPTHSEVSQKDEGKYCRYIKAYIWNLEK